MRNVGQFYEKKNNQHFMQMTRKKILNKLKLLQKLKKEINK